MRRQLRRALERAGLDVHSRGDVPFGTRWEDDLGYYLGGRPLGIALDVGAHKGETARRLTERFPGCRVHSFEPVPDTYRTLTDTTRGMNVVCVQAAVGEHDGLADIAAGAGGSSHSGFRAGGSTVQVRVTTLDSYAAEHELSRIGLLKVDTEGHEAAVLRGAHGLLQDGRVDHVLCECEFVERPEEPHGDFAEISRILTPLGYRVVSFYTGGVDELGWRWGDVLFRGPAIPVARSPHRGTASAAEAAMSSGTSLETG